MIIIYYNLIVYKRIKNLKPIYVTKKTLPNNVAGDCNSSDNDVNIFIYIGELSFNFNLSIFFNVYDDFNRFDNDDVDDDNDDVDDINDNDFFIRKIMMINNNDICRKLFIVLCYLSVYIYLCAAKSAAAVLKNFR